jgi:hypothetical protein
MSRFEQARQRILSERERFLQRLSDPERQQEQILTACLAENRDTVFGRDHGFAGIHCSKEYRRAVPIRDYDGLSPWLSRVFAGEKNILTAEDPVLFFTSSGSTGDSKKIPVTATFMHRCFFPFYYSAFAPLVEHFPEVFARDDSTLNLKHDPIPIQSRSAAGQPNLGASQVDFGKYFGEPLAAEPGSFAPWASLPEELVVRDHLERAYCRLRIAVEHDLRCVIGINPAMVAAVPYHLSRWWPRIAKELRDGTVGGVPFGTKNPSRAEELERLASYFGTLAPLHVWPRMQVLFCWNTGLAGLYLPRVRESFGPSVQILPAPIAASEAPIAVAIDRHPTAGMLVLSSTFLEFLDATEEIRADSRTVSFDALEGGREYHVIVTQPGGLYRYPVGDVVRVVDFVRGLPRVEYAGRKNVSSAVGERLREAHVVRALDAALTTMGLDIQNFSCRIRPGAPPRYELALAARSNFSEAERQALPGFFDEELSRQNEAYRAARKALQLGAPEASFTHPHAFFHEWEHRVRQGCRPSQVKDRVFQQNEATWELLQLPQ